MTVTAFQQANQLLREGKLEEAVVAYRQAIEHNSQFYGAYQNLGETLGKLGRFDEAVEMYRKAIELKPSADWLHQELELLEKLSLGSAVVEPRMDAVLRNLGEGENTAKVGEIGEHFGINPSINLKNNQYNNLDEYTPLRVAVCIHVFYEHIWERISQYLDNIIIPFDLFITCPVEKKSAVSTTVHRTYPQANIETVKNLGMDVAPFIHCVKFFELWSYDVVLKLHTKNDLSATREEMGNILFQGTLGSTDLVNQILKNFSTDNKLGMVGPDYLYRSAQYLMYGNRDIVDSLSRYLHLESYQGDWGFFVGTMFWIRGSLLQVIADAFRPILKLFASSQATITGGDGTPAHSFERLFGLLPTASGMKTGLTYRCNSDATEFFLQIPEIENLLERTLRYADSTVDLTRSKNAKEWAKLIAQSDFFDAGYYLTSRQDMIEVASRSPATHFILYGDPEGYDPCPKFSTVYYHLRNTDVRRHQLPALVHYITHGMKEGRKALPSKLDWLELAEQQNLFSDAWYRENYPDAGLNGLTPKESYMTNGWLQGRATSKNFDPKLLPVVNEMCKVSQKDPLEVYLSEYALSEYALYDAISRAFSNNDFYIVPQIVERLHQKLGETRASLEALGTSLILQKNWDEARSAWGKVWYYFLNQSFIERCVSSVVPYDRNGANQKSNFKEIEVSRLYTRNLQNCRLCVYTTLYGDRDNLPPILSFATGVDYICFTDRPRPSVGWQLRVIDPGLGDNNLNAKIFKILPHIYLQEYDYSLFVDANTLFVGRINDLIKKCLSGSDFVMWKHPVRNDVYWEVATIMAHRRHGPDGLIDQIEAYANSDLPRNTGLVEGSFIWRQHKNKTIASFMEEWWQHIQNYTRRDQVSLGYLMWRIGIRPLVLPDELGTSRDNIYLVKIPHKRNLYEVGTDSVVTSNEKSLSFKNADVIFLYNPKFATSGSTVMRGEQLANLVRPHTLDNRSVFYTSNDNVYGKILFLTKGYLQSSTPELLEKLKKQDNIIIADFVDAVPEKEIVEIIDVLVAASLSAYINYSQNWPQKQIHYITHHVDPRISKPKHDNFNKKPRLGYFGEIVNTIKSDKIAELVDFYLVDTSGDNSATWLNPISEYNCHYAVRQTRKIDGYKPFTKGFIAAHCEANIIVQESATDVKYYLGVDYPYLLPDDPDEREILYMLQRVLTEYGGREWNYGLEIMQEVRERSSPERVIQDFNYLLSSL